MLGEDRLKASTEFVRGRFIHGYLAVPLNVHVNRFLLFFDRKCALKATHLDNQFKIDAGENPFRWFYGAAR